MSSYRQDSGSRSEKRRNDDYDRRSYYDRDRHKRPRTESSSSSSRDRGYDRHRDRERDQGRDGDRSRDSEQSSRPAQRSGSSASMDSTQQSASLAKEDQLRQSLVAQLAARTAGSKASSRSSTPAASGVSSPVLLDVGEEASGAGERTCPVPRTGGSSLATTVQRAADLKGRKSSASASSTGQPAAAMSSALAKKGVAGQDSPETSAQPPSFRSAGSDGSPASEPAPPRGHSPTQGEDVRARYGLTDVIMNTPVPVTTQLDVPSPPDSPASGAAEAGEPAAQSPKARNQGEVDQGEPEPEPEPEPEEVPYYPAVSGCRSISVYEKMNRIDEGTYGVVFRVKDPATGEAFAVKKLKMEKETEGFPITALREINTLLKAKHENIVNVHELVVGASMDDIFIVMEFVAHDLKALLESMPKPFLQSEVKTLMLQLLRGVHHLHDNWILHRDLKTSNLLLSHRGVLKIADFGLAREYGDPLHRYTPLVVTLWYRAPELLLGEKMYSTKIDIWSVGCIMAELITSKPLFPGKGEIEMLNRIFRILGTPDDTIWPGFSRLPASQKVTFKRYTSTIKEQFALTAGNEGLSLLQELLTYDPEYRITAEEALQHEWFSAVPKPKPRELLPHFPARAEGGRRRKQVSPSAPNAKLREQQQQLEHLLALKAEQDTAASEFSLKFGP